MISISTSVELILLSDPFLVGFSVLVFDIPRYTFSIFATAFLRVPTKSPSSDWKPTITAIISSHNGADTLLRSISTLNLQSLPPTEIIVIDDGSTDGTRRIAEQALEKHLITALFRHGTRCGKSAAINHGARFAKGDLIINIDDDTALEQTALADLSSAFEDPKVAVASGNLTIGNNNASLSSSLQAIEYLVSITAGRRFLDVLGSVSCCSGAFSMFRRNAYDAMGGMNVGPGEDLEFTLRARKVGHRVRFVSSASAQVDALITFRGLLRQRQRWDRDSLRIRIFMYRELNLRKPLENLSDTIQRLDFIIFDLLPTLAFPFYLSYLAVTLGWDAIPYLVGLYIILLTLALVNIAVVVITTRHRLSLFDAAATFIFPFYQGFALKLTRFVAYSTEFMFPMRRDSYVPPRVLRALFEER